MLFISFPFSRIPICRGSHRYLDTISLNLSIGLRRKSVILWRLSCCLNFLFLCGRLWMSFFLDFCFQLLQLFFLLLFKLFLLKKSLLLFSLCCLLFNQTTRVGFRLFHQMRKKVFSEFLTQTHIHQLSFLANFRHRRGRLARIIFTLTAVPS